MDQHNEVEIVISDHCDSEWDSDDEKQTSGEVKNSTQSFQILFANKKLARLNHFQKHANVSEHIKAEEDSTRIVCI